MKMANIKEYIAPQTRQPLEIASIEKQDGPDIVEGMLKSKSAGEIIPIRNSIPRFVGNENYARSFGFQWKSVGLTTGIGSAATGAAAASANSTRRFRIRSP